MDIEHHFSSGNINLEQHQLVGKYSEIDFFEFW